MKTFKISYDACRLYLTDQHNVGAIPEDIFNTLLGATRARDLKVLTACTNLFDPEFHGAEVMRSLLQVEALFKKNEHFSNDVECEGAALRTFIGAERQCRITNKRLDWYYLHRERIAPAVSVLLDRMERWIHSTLGPIQPFMDSIPLNIRLTNGASSALKRKVASPARKLAKANNLCATAGSVPYLRALGRYFGLKLLPGYQVTRSNRVAFVLKNWLTKRTIAAEPEGSLPFQLCFDTYAKGQLRRVGVDLSSQLKNQELARRASRGERIATLDLKTASDTCAYNAVAWLFPTPWFDYLRAHRSSSYTVKVREDVVRVVKTGEYAKFSSMGNGSTFTIETLLFAAACKASGASVWSVYGDDIIVDADKAEAVIEVLRFLGFTVNSSKSHLSGPYHESCGEHWYEDRLITPFYLRNDDLGGAKLCHAVNGLATIALPGGLLADFLVKLVKEGNLPIVPYSENTLNGVHVNVPACYRLGVFRRSGKRHPWGTPRYTGFEPVQVWPALKEGDRPRELHELSEQEREALKPGASIGLYLWYLDSCNRELDREGKTDHCYELETRKVFKLYGDEFLMPPDLQLQRKSHMWDVPAVAYRKRSCRWWLPSRPTPITLHWWSEHLASSLTGNPG